MVNIDECFQNVGMIIKNFRGTVNGQVLTAEEHLAIASSFKGIVEEYKRLKDVEAELNKLKEEKKE
jgi:hypothetical protein